ncbi:MAG: PIN domain-containing protein [Thermomicrobiales bacterium]|nr:PIN domain-containing protein [Thermomicrobiales bacterium]
MTSAVLDTNVLVSGFIGADNPASTPGELIRRWRAKAFELVVSEHILSELADTFTDPYFARRRLLRQLSKHSTHCELMPLSSRLWFPSAE